MPGSPGAIFLLALGNTVPLRLYSAARGIFHLAAVPVFTLMPVNTLRQVPSRAPGFT